MAQSSGSTAFFDKTYNEALALTEEVYAYLRQIDRKTDGAAPPIEGIRLRGASCPQIRGDDLFGSLWASACVVPDSKIIFVNRDHKRQPDNRAVIVREYLRLVA